MRYLFLGLFGVLMGAIFGKVISTLNKKHIENNKEELPLKIKSNIYIILISAIIGIVLIIDLIVKWE